MDETVAKALEGLVGPLVASGMKVGMAENVAKIRAFRAGTYPGEPCDYCSKREGLLWPIDNIYGISVHLCHDCQGAEAYRKERARLSERLRDVAQADA